MFYDLAVSDRFELLVMGVVLMNMIALMIQTFNYKPPCDLKEVGPSYV
jgi:hypothetical protein